MALLVLLALTGHASSMSQNSSPSSGKRRHVHHGTSSARTERIAIATAGSDSDDSWQLPHRRLIGGQEGLVHELAEHRWLRHDVCIDAMLRVDRAHFVQAGMPEKYIYLVRSTLIAEVHSACRPCPASARAVGPTARRNSPAAVHTPVRRDR